jgi:hypothetical protein
MRFTVATDHAAGADQDRAVEVDAIAIDLRHADDDVAIMLARERRKALGGRAGDLLNEGRHLLAVEPAIAGGPHLGRDDEAGAGLGRLLAQIEQARDVALLLEHRRLELDGRDLVNARHRRSVLTPGRIS